MGELDAAEVEIRRAIELDAHDPAAWLQLGALFVQRGDVTAARVSYERALGANPSLDEAREALARLPR
jgi:Flp pilus assembly protein TadD